MSSRTTASSVALTVVVAVLAGAGSVVAAAPPARADLVTTCDGVGGPVTVPNDLVVPADASCTLDGTTVTGNVEVAARANLVMTGGRVNGDIRVAGDGYLDATGTTVGGQILLEPGGFGLYLRGVSSGPVTVRPRGSAVVEGFLLAENVTVEGGVTANVGEVRLDRTSQVTGNVSTSGTYYTDVHDSFVDGTLSVLNNATGSVVCGSAVRGRATFAGNLGGVQLGPNGPLDSCPAGGYFGSDVNVNNTSGGVTVDGNLIDGQLQLAANTPAATVAANNRIRGGVVGGTAGSPAPRAAPGAGRVSAAGRALVRRGQAVTEARATGPVMVGRG